MFDYGFAGSLDRFSHPAETIWSQDHLEQRRGFFIGKRIFDIVLSVLLLPLLGAFALLLLILNPVLNPGTLFFVQPRMGRDCVPFPAIKFRTMRVDAEKSTGPVWASADDPRITRVGKWLRLTRIDEIPQLINVLAGHMSFVGPRPERPYFVEDLSKNIEFYPLRLTVKPGVTGWAQVNMAYAASIEDTMEKLRYDLYYIKNISLLFDVNILLRTVGVILFGKGAR